MPSAISWVQFDGVSADTRAGHAIAAVGRINNNAPSAILIGSPGANGAAGEAYLIPANPGLFGELSLTNNESPTIAGTTITVSPQTGQPPGSYRLGSSVSASLASNGANRTIDSDPSADLIIGASRFSPTQSALGAAPPSCSKGPSSR